MLLCELHLPDDATIQSALFAARRLLRGAQVDWDHAASGIYGKVLARTHIWADGDRIELYRPLLLDPRARRRQRAAKGRGRG